MEKLTTFADLGVSPSIIQGLYEMGFEEPTPIQKDTIPKLMQGADLLGQAQTGTGKTAAFGIPLIQNLGLLAPSNMPKALIIVPTRELANQVTVELNKIGKFSKLKTIPIFGGQSIDRQLVSLARNPQIIVGTPGRILDHIRRGSLNLSEIQSFILDEADEMLDMGFIDDINTIINSITSPFQFMLFSATMPTEIQKMAQTKMNNPVIVKVRARELTAATIQQIFYELENWEKLEALCRIVDVEDSKLFLVFCQTKKEVDDLTKQLSVRGYFAEALHGDYSQYKRDQVMRNFRENKLDILVATDVAARGIDVSHVSHVVNYSLPQQAESYIHRIGRTGRAGREGMAITFVTPSEYKQLMQIEKVARTRLQKGKLPTRKELFSVRKIQMLGQITASKEKVEPYFVEWAEKLMEKGDERKLLAVALKIAYNNQYPEINLDREGIIDSYSTGGEKGMARLFINGGRNYNITHRDIIQALVKSELLNGSDIGKIHVLDDFTFVEVPEELAASIIAKMSRFKLNDKIVTIQPARIKKTDIYNKNRSNGSSKKIKKVS